MSTAHRWIFALLFASVAAARLAAFQPDGYALWADGTITMHLQMGSSPTLTDGSTYNTSLDEALKQWNRNLGRVQFASVIGSAVPVGRGNGRNNVVFRNDVYGEEFGENVLAVALSSTNSTSRTESDVIFNQAEKWDSYRGSLVYPKYDIRRVALHEFGHVLGLTHPDQAGQYVTAVMNSTTSHVDALQADDKEGAAALYGPGIDNPYTPPAIVAHPYPQSATEGQSASFDVYASGMAPLTYQWRKDGNPIEGATSSRYTIDVVRRSDAGAYSVVVSNPGGSVTSSDAQLSVTAAMPPSFSSKLENAKVEVGTVVSFGAWGVSGSYPMTYQWYKDGVALTGATGYSLIFNPATAADAGAYTVEVTNIAGSTRSNEAMLTVLPMALPTATSISTSGTATLGQSFSLNIYSSSQAPVRYQWFKDGLPIAGATSGTLSFSPLVSADAGQYLVVTTNAAGATSSAALVVNPTVSNIAPGAWLSAAQHGDVCYFLYVNPARIERYQADSGWLTAIALESTPTAFAVDSAGIYVAANRVLRRFAHDGTGATTIATLSYNIKELLVSTDYLYALQAVSSATTKFTTLRRDTGAFVAESGTYYYDIARGVSFAASQGRIFGRSEGVSPSDIEYVVVNTDGSYGVAGDSPYHGSFPDATRTWVNADETQVADDSGTIYATSDLTSVGDLGGAVTSLASYNSGWVALRGDSLVHYDAQFEEVGRATLSQSGLALFIAGDEALIFCAPSLTTRDVAVVRQSLAALTPPPSTAAVAPAREPFPVDDLFMDEAGVVHILSRPYRNLFRWSAGARRYLDSLPLRRTPTSISYSPVMRHAFIGYDRLVTRIATSAEAPTEEVFVTTAGKTHGLAALGQHLLVSSASSDFRTYDETGRQASSSNYVSSLSAWIWNDTTRRLHTLSYSSLFMLEILPDGSFGETKSSSYWGYNFRAPMRSSPNGENILFSTGEFFDAATLQPNNVLPTEINDAAWLGGTLFTAYSQVDGIHLRQWSALNYAETGSSVIPGRVLRLFPWGTDKLVLVGLRDGYLFFAVIGADLTVHSVDENKPRTRLSNLSARAHVGTDENILIPGFVIGGTGKKKLLIRAVGPTLANYGVSRVLADPTITVHDHTGATIASNDQWADNANLAELTPLAKALGAFDLAASSKDSALLISLDPGLYTVHAQGTNDATGVGLVELYDADERESTARLINLSTRAQVGTGESVLIPGIVVDGDSPATVLVRAVGPTLTKYGVGGVLADPQLQILDKDGKAIASNDNWWNSQNTSQLTTTSTSVGAFALDSGSNDAALLVTLPPGLYTAHVKGANDTTGVALVEVYYVSP